MLETVLIIYVALLLDWWLGEPKRFHPLVGFGYLVNKVESSFRHLNSASHLKQFILGTLAVLILITPISGAAYLISLVPYLNLVVSLVIVTLCIGHKSLHDHTQPIAEALLAGNNTQARLLTSRIVSRDPATLNIANASIESILEHGSDSVFAALFWFIVAGIPGIVIYRLSNTLDAMWGYKNERYLYFGRFSARLDDALNYIPARLTALSYSLLGSTKHAISSWKTQAAHCESPNAGPVMAAGAGALQITIGGPAKYHGQWHQRPVLGAGPIAQAVDITRALSLVRNTVFLWLAVLFVMAGFSYA